MDGIWEYYVRKINQMEKKVIYVFIKCGKYTNKINEQAK